MRSAKDADVRRCARCHSTMHTYHSQCPSSSSWTSFGALGWTCSLRCTNELRQWEFPSAPNLFAVKSTKPPNSFIHRIVSHTPDQYTVEFHYRDGGVPQKGKESKEYMREKYGSLTEAYEAARLGNKNQ